MGIYLNPGNRGFQMSLNSKIYIDKSKLISYTNSVIDTAQRFVCVSRPRRFGKSVTAEMLAAYYGKWVGSSRQFCNLPIAEDSAYQTHLNRYDVIFFQGKALPISYFFQGKPTLPSQPFSLNSNGTNLWKGRFAK